MPTDVAENGEGCPPVFSFPFFSFIWIKGRFPPLHGPRIYLILVLFFIFFSFFFLLLFYFTCTHECVTKSLATRARVFHDIIMLFFSFSLSPPFTTLAIIIIIRLVLFSLMLQTYDRARHSDLFYDIFLSRSLCLIYIKSSSSRANH